MMNQKITFSTPNGKYGVIISKYEDEIHPHVHIRIKGLKHRLNYYSNTRKFPKYLIDQIEEKISNLNN